MTFEWFLGIDWGQDAHEFCLTDTAGEVRGRRQVAHTAIGIYEGVQWVRHLTGGAAVAVGIETPRGVLVDALLEHPDLTVFALNPRQLDRFRDRFTAAGAKDDTRDAHALADGVRT